MKQVRGVTLIEMLVVLAVSTMVITFTAQAMQRYGDNLANRATAEHQTRIRDAALRFIDDNRGAIAAASGPSTPYALTVQKLIDDRYLPAGFSTVNAYGQTPYVRVVQPSAGVLQGFLVTPGGNMSGQSLRSVAQLVGADGGYSETAGAAATARGAYGAWTTSLAPIGGTATAKSLVTALFVSEAGGTASSGDALMRTATPGQPELNTMSTDLNMGVKNITNAAQVTANVVTGTAVVNSPEVLAGVMSFGGTRYGAPTYANETVSLPAGTNMRFNIGNVQQAVVQNDGYVWARTGLQTTYANVWDVNASGGVNSSNHVYGRTQVSTNGEMYADGWFRTRGDSGWFSEKWCGGWYMADSTWIRTYCGKNVYINAEMRANRITTEARISAGEYLDVNGWASRGGWCEKHGLIGQDGNGALFCKGNTWVGMGGPTGGSYTYLGQFTGSYTGYNTSGYNSMVVLIAQASGCSNNGYSVQMYVNGGWIGNSHDGNRTDAKVGYSSFMVPSGGNFTITPAYTGYCNTQVQAWQYFQS